MMPYQRPIFALCSMTYCICLGIFALVADRHSRVNRIFAAFNFASAFYNAADFVIFIPNHAVALWYSRLTNMNVAWTIPMITYFVYEVTGVSEQPVYRKRIKFAFALGAVSDNFASDAADDQRRELHAV